MSLTDNTPAGQIGQAIADALADAIAEIEGGDPVDRTLSELADLAASNGWTEIEDRALALLDDLSEGHPVVVLDELQALR